MKILKKNIPSIMTYDKILYVNVYIYRKKKKNYLKKLTNWAIRVNSI